MNHRTTRRASLATLAAAALATGCAQGDLAYPDAAGDRVASDGAHADEATTGLDGAGTDAGDTGLDARTTDAMHDGAARVDALPVVHGASPRDLYAVHGAMTGSGTTEVHALAGADGFQTFTVHSPTALAPTGVEGAWTLLMGDFDLDGVRDLFAVNHGTTGSGSTELHVLDGASGYTVYSAHAVTALDPTGTSLAWTFLLGDYDGDGHVDLFAIDHAAMTGSGMTEVHVLDGSHGFDRFLLHAATGLAPSGASEQTAFALADQDGDGVPDLYAIERAATGSGTTEVHALSGASNYQSFVVHSASALPLTGTDHAWWFGVADADADGVPDLYAVQRAGGASGMTEATVLSGHASFASAILRGPVGLGAAGTDWAWQFDLARPAALAPHVHAGPYTRAIAKSGGANGGGYAYAPSILRDATGYHLWACDSDGVHLGDTVAYTHSVDGATWSAPVTALYMPSALQHTLEHTCDPSVVRFAPPGDPGGRTFYYLFHSSDSVSLRADGSFLATVNSVARSLVPQGPYGHYMGGDPNSDANWVVDPGTRQPVFIQRAAAPCPAGTEASCYGAGEPSVVVRGATLHMWYTDANATPPANYHTTSTDGVNWSAAQSIGMFPGSSDVKFDAATGRYVLVGMTGNHTPTPRFAYATSADGVHWTPFAASTAMPAYASEVGWSGDERGYLVAGQTVYGFAAPYGLGATDTWGQWELYLTPVRVARE